MTDLVLIARQRTPVDSRTHYHGCERKHVECLVQMMATEIEHLRNNSDNLRIVIQDSAREIEQLRADAERYRWLRNDAMETDTMVPIVCIVDRRGRAVSDDEGFADMLNGTELDAAIDAAMKEKRDE